MQRQAWIDNLRITVIILVVILHAAVTYSGIGGWYYKENKSVDTFSTLFFAFYLTFNQAYFMSLLFLVSGYFTRKSLLRKGAGKFLKGRLFRLGIPLLIYIFIIQPIAVGLANPDLDVLEWYLNGIRNFNFIGWTGPLWFVEALLIFTLFYLFILRFTKRLHFRNKIRPSTGNVIILVGIISFFAFAIRLVYPIGTDFYNLQFSFFSGYIIMFAIGILAYSSALFDKISLKDGKKWLAISLGLGIPAWFAIMLFGGPMDGVMLIEGGLNWPAFFYAIWESFICVTFSLALIGLYKHRMDFSGKLQQFLSDNAFGVFAFHAPVLIGISMLLKNVQMYPVLKFLLVSCLAVSFSFLVSFLIRRLKPLKKVFS